ncbi:MAG: hypothetical protein DRJ37_06270 [Thermoprotei archaeon]|nr:MAG: hypothetical protein DRJ37_06270 [Thermoprotei archaeon]
MEAILYDTGVLIELNKKTLKGYTTALNVVEYPKILKIKGLKVIYPNARDYTLAMTISKDLYKIGKPVPAIDIVIAAVAINRGLTLITKNRHFEYIKEVRREFSFKII